MHRDPDSEQADDALNTNTGVAGEDDKKPSAKDDIPETVAPKPQNGEENGKTESGAGRENTQKPAPSSTAQKNDANGPSDGPPETSSPYKQKKKRRRQQRGAKNANFGPARGDDGDDASSVAESGEVDTVAARTPSEDPPPGLPAATEQNPPGLSADVQETPAPAAHKKTRRGPKKRSAKRGDAEGEGIAEDPLAEGEQLGSEATGSEQAENTKTAETGAARDDTGDSKPDTLKSRAGARAEMFRRERFPLDVFPGAAAEDIYEKKIRGVVFDALDALAKKSLGQSTSAPKKPVSETPARKTPAPKSRVPLGKQQGP